MPRIRLRQHALPGSLIALTALLIAHYAGAPLPWPSAADRLYNVIEGGAAVACLLRAWRGPERGAWLALGLGVASFAAGDLWFTLVEADDPSFPSPADGLFLATYPAFCVGLVLLTRARMASFPRAVWLDGLIGALALSTIGAALLVAPIMAQTGGSLSTVVTNLVYPLGDLLLIALLGLALLLTGRQRDMRWVLLAAGFVLFGVTDSVFLAQTAAGSYQDQTLLDAGWPLALVLIGVAASFSAPPVRRERDAGWPAFAVPGVSGLVVVALEIRDHYVRVDASALWLGGVCLLAVLARLLLALADNQRVAARREHEALTDPLTGLGNRRRLMADLERAVAGPPHVLALFDLDGFKAYNDTFGHPAGDHLLGRLAPRLQAAMRDGRAYRIGGDEFCVLVPCPDGRQDEIVARAAAALSESGAAFTLRASHGAVLLPVEATAASDALQIVDRRMYAHKAAGKREDSGHTAAALLRALHERRPDLCDHDEGVGLLAARVAARLGLMAAEVAQVRVAAELHDIGKLAVPDAILDKPGPLDTREWAVMRRHTEVGARIVESDATLARVATMVRGSHERWEGGGYPDGISGEEIPVGARIICACDAWDAMTTTRPYRGALPDLEALAELRGCAGTQFDPQVIDALIAELAAEREPRLAA